MVDYGLKDRVAIVTGANNPQGIGAATAIAFVREGAKVVLTYRRVPREYDDAKAGQNGVDRYYGANAGDASEVEEKLIELGADYLVLEKDISDENQVREIFDEAVGRFGHVDVLVNNAATDDETG
ncbi:MAG: SDR family NAD(P)-dependent oxidoreductase, partial [Coriobacteriales bacterium]|nr:SDR family NAD(P)-dependent oxidoreductase [Coriobacteriales bacterium]